MARVLRSTKITIAEDPSTTEAPQHQDKPRTESRGPLEPLDNVTETVLVSVDEANEADEEKLLKAAFKSAIGVKKKKKNKKDRRSKFDSSEQVSTDNATPEEKAENPIDASENDNDKLQHLLKDLQDTHITAPTTVPAQAQDITLIRNVPTEPAAHRRTRSQHNSVRHAQPGQYIPPSHYPYPHGGNFGPQWSHRPGFGHHGPPAPLPYSYHPPAFIPGAAFHGQPGMYAGPPRALIQGYQNGSYDGYNHNEQIRRWISQSSPPQHSFAVPDANMSYREVEQQMQQQQREPIYVYTGPQSRYVSNSTIEISATGVEESADDAPAEAHAEVEVEGETEIEAQVQAQIQDNEKSATEVVEASIDAASDHDMEENEEASVAEVIAPPPTQSETELVKDETPASIIESSHDEDSFIHHIVERSPAKPARRRSSIDDDLKLRFQSRPTSRAEEMVDDFEKFQDIITRSPARPVFRIEDSVEKLDQEFDLMEALVEATSPRASPAKGNSPVQSVPAVKTNTPQTPTPATKTPLRRAATVTSRSTPAASSVGVRGGRLLTSRMAADKASTGTATVRVAKAPVPRQSIAPAGLRRAASVASGSVQSRDTPFSSARPPVKRPLSLLPPKLPVKSVRAPTRPTFELPGEKVARELKEKREAREARMAAREAEAEKAGPVKRAVTVAPVVRSSKLPTRPSFELPGDALSRKKREEHVAKLKAQEEEERKRREFKARPVRKSVVSSVAAPRETAASLARRSIVGTPSDLTIGKRSLRPSIAEIDHDNVVHSAPRTRVSNKTFERKSSAGTTRPAGPSMSGLAMQRTSSNASVPASAAVPASKKLNGKELYRRDARAMENAEDEKKAKQEAARKAREEAAERGRQASREWAEKQKMKMEEKNRALGEKVGEGGLSAGAKVEGWLTRVEVVGMRIGRGEGQAVRVEIAEVEGSVKETRRFLRTMS